MNRWSLAAVLGGLVVWISLIAVLVSGDLPHRLIGLFSEVGKYLSLVTATSRKPGDTFKDCVFCPEMVVIPVGAFGMGDIQGGGKKNERPVHTVRIGKMFAMGKYEVRFAEYDRFVEATQRWNLLKRDWKSYPGGKPLFSLVGYNEAKAYAAWRSEKKDWTRRNRPATVAWDDAKAYAAWLSKKTGKMYRLPTEGEWEYAARAGSRTAYWWGSDIKQDRKVWANCDGCGSDWDNKRTSPVGQFPANEFGLHDTAGNVWEWVEDCWKPNYSSGNRGDGSAWEGDCTRRVNRGGSWSSKPWYLRSAARDSTPPYMGSDGLGFRVVQDLPQGTVNLTLNGSDYKHE